MIMGVRGAPPDKRHTEEGKDSPNHSATFPCALSLSCDLPVVRAALYRQGIQSRRMGCGSWVRGVTPLYPAGPYPHHLEHHVLLLTLFVVNCLHAT